MWVSGTIRSLIDLALRTSPSRDQEKIHKADAVMLIAATGLKILTRKVKPASFGRRGSPITGTPTHYPSLGGYDNSHLGSDGASITRARGHC